MVSTKVGPFGGKGGEEFDDGEYNGIRQLIIHAGQVINSIQCEYDKHGQPVWSKLYGQPVWSKVYGQPTSPPDHHHTVNLNYPNEYIVSISGYQGKYHVGATLVHVVTSLTIKSNVTTYGPFGEKKGKDNTPFSFPTFDGKVVGFFGRSGAYLDAIGGHVSPISIPAIIFGPYGGVGGVEWNDGTHTGIKQLEIVAGDVVNEIRIEYDDEGQSFWSERHGQISNADRVTVKLDYPNEYIVSIIGYQGNYPSGAEEVHVITSLTIKTNLKTYGPFGNEKGQGYTSFTFPTFNGKVVGFVGRAGAYIDAIGGYVVPLLPTSTKLVGPFGGQGGVEWNDHAHTGIKQLEIGSGDVVNHIRIEYDDDGKSFWSERHGHLSNADKVTVELDYPKEFIISISGYRGNYPIGAKEVHIITSLTIQTSLKTYGPFGNENGKDYTSFSFPASDAKVVGFFGRAGAYLDAIGGYVVTLPKQPQILGPYGGQGGVEWNDEAHTGIKQLEIASGDVVNEIRIEYDDDGKFFWSERHGQVSNADIVTVKLDYPNEFIVSIAGYHGNYPVGAEEVHVITSLTITTNLTTHGPFGKEKGSDNAPFSFPGFDGKVVGFLGRSGAYLDAIGGYVVKN